MDPILSIGFSRRGRTIREKHFPIKPIYRSRKSLRHPNHDAKKASS
jgi:hypothetical protein